MWWLALAHGRRLARRPIYQSQISHFRLRSCSNQTERGNSGSSPSIIRWREFAVPDTLTQNYLHLGDLSTLRCIGV